MIDPVSRGPEVLVVLTTAPDEGAADELAGRLVEERLAACVNVVPGVRSVYRWKGEIHRDGEVLLILKSTPEALPRLRARLPELHPYDVPELVALEAVDGLPAYLAWVRDQVEPAP